MTIDQRIKIYKEEFTSSELFIAKKIITKPEIFINNDISELSSLLFVSNATITRFCKKINVNGFKELKFILSQENSNKKIINNNDNIINQLISDYSFIINDLDNFINEKTIAKINYVITSSKNVYVIGVGSSGFIARDFSFRLSRLGLKCQAITDFEFIKMQINTSAKNDLFIFISNSAKTKNILSALNLCSLKEITTLIITSNLDVQNMDISKYTLVAPFSKDINFNASLSSSLPIIFICDLLFFSLYDSDSNFKENFEKTLPY